MSRNNIWRVAPDALYVWRQVERQCYSSYVVHFANNGDFVPDTAISQHYTAQQETGISVSV